MKKKNNASLEVLKKYKAKVIIAPILKLFEVCTELLIPFLIKYIIDKGIVNKDFNYTLKMCLLMFGLALVAFGVTMIAQFLAAKVSSDYGKDLKEKLYDHVLHMNEEDLNAFGKQKIQTILNTDSFQMQNAVMMFMRLFLRPPFIIIGATIICFTIDYRAGLIFLGACLLSSLTIFLITRFVNPEYRKNQMLLDELSKDSTNVLEGIKVVHTFSNEKVEEKKFQTLTNSFKERQIKIGKINALINPLTFFFINLAIVLVVYLGGFGESGSFLSTGSIASLISYLVTALAALVMFSKMIISLNKASASMERINELLNEKEKENIATNNYQFDEHAPLLEFKNVYFSYNNSEKYVLENISFELGNNDSLGIIGGTGSGKSTIVNLINRIYKPTKGTIYFKGVDINEIDGEVYSTLISTAFQKHAIYKGTIKDNIITKYPFNEVKINKVLHDSLAEMYVKDYKDGINHLVEENATNLSGGQKQRLLIARTLYKDCSLLIFDDSTSALDYISDKNVRNNINEYQNAKIYISQRVTTLMNLPKIIVMDNGKIVAFGNHERLMKDSILYKNIYDIQRGLD